MDNSFNFVQTDQRNPYVKRLGISDPVCKKLGISDRGQTCENCFFKMDLLTSLLAKNRPIYIDGLVKRLVYENRWIA